MSRTSHLQYIRVFSAWYSTTKSSQTNTDKLFGENNNILFRLIWANGIRNSKLGVLSWVGVEDFNWIWRYIRGKQVFPWTNDSKQEPFWNCTSTVLALSNNNLPNFTAQCFTDVVTFSKVCFGEPGITKVYREKEQCIIFKYSSLEGHKIQRWIFPSHSFVFSVCFSVAFVEKVKWCVCRACLRLCKNHTNPWATLPSYGWLMTHPQHTLGLNISCKRAQVNWPKKQYVTGKSAPSSRDLLAARNSGFKITTVY